MRLRWHRVSVHRYAVSRFVYERATINARLSLRYIGATVTIDRTKIGTRSGREPGVWIKSRSRCRASMSLTLN